MRSPVGSATSYAMLSITWMIVNGPWFLKLREWLGRVVWTLRKLIMTRLPFLKSGAGSRLLLAYWACFACAHCSCVRSFLRKVLTRSAYESARCTSACAGAVKLSARSGAGGSNSDRGWIPFVRMNGLVPTELMAELALNSAMGKNRA
jgi:hypothetical protein